MLLVRLANGDCKVDSRDFRQARDRANPFESIKKEFFGTSRAALKMANLDAIFDFMFTGAADTNKSLLYFADICSGPGGFTEYVPRCSRGHPFPLFTYTLSILYGQLQASRPAPRGFAGGG